MMVVTAIKATCPMFTFPGPYGDCFHFILSFFFFALFSVVTFVFETSYHCVAQADLALTVILQPQPPWP